MNQFDKPAKQKTYMITYVNKYKKVIIENFSCLTTDLNLPVVDSV